MIDMDFALESFALKSYIGVICRFLHVRDWDVWIFDCSNRIVLRFPSSQYLKFV